MAKQRPQYYLHNQDSSPKVSAEFQELLREALLMTLVEKGFLTLPQYERCIAEIKKQA